MRGLGAHHPLLGKALAMDVVPQDRYYGSCVPLLSHCWKYELEINGFCELTDMQCFQKMCRAISRRKQDSDNDVVPKLVSSSAL